MDVFLFAALLQNLLHIQVLNLSREKDALLHFQEKYCYHSALQPAFKAETLSRLTSEAQENTLYGLQDDLGICIIFFVWGNDCFLIGPFVRSGMDENKLQQILLAHHMPGSYAASVRLYYEAFPMISSTHVRNTIIACLRALNGKNQEFSYCRLSGARADVQLPQPLHEESLDYSTLHQRYDLENHFLRMIETGDVENVLIAQREMTHVGIGQVRYMNAVYMDTGVGLAMIRALARKAAERGGASLVEIHEITQRAVQRIYASRNASEQSRHSNAMILELTEAVRRSQAYLGSYSGPIRRVVEHIRLNYSQKISLSALAEISHLSEAYLSKAFKKEVGTNITQFVEQLRCEKAAEMLRESQTPVQEISSYVGYDDNNYFVKVFRKQFGTTPTDYRSSHHQR